MIIDVAQIFLLFSTKISEQLFANVHSITTRFACEETFINREILNKGNYLFACFANQLPL